MSIISGTVLFVVIWWMVFFCALPIGVRQPEERAPGEMPGAPEFPGLRRKTLWTTLISAGLWLVAYLLIRSDLYSFRR